MHLGNKPNPWFLYKPIQLEELSDRPLTNEVSVAKLLLQMLPWLTAITQLREARPRALVNPLPAAAQQLFVLVERFYFQSLFLLLHYKGKAPPETLPCTAPVSV